MTRMTVSTSMLRTIIGADSKKVGEFGSQPPYCNESFSMRRAQPQAHQVSASALGNASRTLARMPAAGVTCALEATALALEQPSLWGGRTTLGRLLGDMALEDATAL
eukprot:2556235-Amphidinium_carterae.1